MIGTDTSNNIVTQYSKEIKFKFLQFLKKHNAMAKYKHNIIETIDETKIGDVLSVLSCKKMIDPHMRHGQDFNYYGYYMQLINYAFCWSDTPQGHNYWENLNDLWVDELRNFIINKFQKYQHETNNKKNIHRIGTT